MGQERYFYEVPEAPEGLSKEAREGVENFLGAIDSRSASAINRILSNIEASRLLSPSGFPQYILTDEEKTDLAIFIVFQGE